jgi:Raf kinase inhibitor-like YbhB/YbcL family protein
MERMTVHMRSLTLAAVAVVVFGAGAAAQTLTISSPEFKAGGNIPSKFTCDAGRTAPNPALAFGGVPAKTQSLALIMDDPDVPKTMIPSGEFVHWLLWDLLPDAKGIAEGAGTGGMNGMGRPGYMGPCPPDKSHRYFFKLYALDTKITSPIKTKAELVKAMEGHILQQAELMGNYEREKK